MGKRNPKSSKTGISKVKLKNIKGGKMSKGKRTASKPVVKARRKLQLVIRQRANRAKNGTLNPTVEEVTTEDVLDMIDTDELAYLKGAQHKNTQYLVASELKKTCKGRRSKHQENDELENQYESTWAQQMETMKKMKYLLPIKTNKGLEEQTVEEELQEEIEYENETVSEEKDSSDPSANVDIERHINPLNGGVISTAMLLARRQHKLAEYKVKIGILSASFLEDPENRMRNLESLLAMLETSESAVAFTVPKLAAISLLAVFQDVLPAYAIKHNHTQGVKLKMDTRQLQGHESNLLKRYKIYLQKLEKLVGKFCPRIKPKQVLNETESKLGQVALKCMCSMLITHPYFNLAVNVVNFIIPFLNNWDPRVRELVFNAIKSVFRIDKRGEISYEIVRRINILVKAKLSNGKLGLVRRDVLDVLLSLRIKEADLEKEKKEEMAPQGKLTFEQRRMLSKRQRKKSKDLVQLEKELLEASAEENKSQKSHFLTEIIKLVFTMYFRALKTSPRREMLSAVLEGLAKFAHIINVDFFDDLLKVLEGLLKSGELQQRQLLLCVATVLAVLDGQGAALTLDPTTFHKYLYVALAQLRCGKVETDVGLALRCIRLATGRKKMPGPRAVAFVKRIATMALQLEHHDAIASLVELKQVLRLHTSAAVLLDSDGGGASGVYLPELEDPDHCCAQGSTLWELTALSSHYHPWVCQIAKGIIYPEKNEPLPTEVSHKVPEDICRKFEPFVSMDFNPSLKESRKLAPTHKTRNRFGAIPIKTQDFRDDFLVNTLINENPSLLATGNFWTPKIDQ